MAEQRTGILMRAAYVLLFLAVYQLLQIPFLITDQRYNGPEGVYWQVLRQLEAGRELYREIYSPLFPLFVELIRLSRFLPFEDLAAARILISLFAPLALAGFYLLLRRWFTRAVSLTAVFLLAADPFFFNLTHQLTGEIPGLALLFWSAYFFLQAQDEHRARNLFVSAVLLFVAVQFKQVVIVLALAGVLAALVTRRRAIRALDAAVVALGCLILNAICLYAYGYHEGQGFSQLQGGHFLRFVDLLFSAPHHLPVDENIDAVTTTNDYSRMWLYISLPLTVIAAVVLRSFNENRQAALTAVVSALLTLVLFFYVVINPDHLILFTPGLVAALAVLWNRGGSVPASLCGLFLAGSLLFSGLEYDWSFPRANKAQRRAIRALQEHTAPDAVVMGNIPFIITAAGRMTPPEYTDISPARLLSRTLTCAILEERFREGGVTAFVFRNKGMEYIDCGHEEFQRTVQRYFPTTVYEDFRLKIFTVDP